jgi:hypothetical protein
MVLHDRSLLVLYVEALLHSSGFGAELPRQSKLLVCVFSASAGWYWGSLKSPSWHYLRHRKPRRGALFTRQIFEVRVQTEPSRFSKMQ